MHKLIITTNKVKKELLLERTKKKKISNDKILTKNEVKDIILGKLNSSSTYKLCEKFNLSINIASVYTKNLLYKHENLKKYYDFLNEINYIEKYNKEKYDEVELINVSIDDYMMEYFLDSKIKKSTELGTYKHPVYRFAQVEDEVSWIAEKIIESKEEITKIKLVNVLDEYKQIIKKIFKMYKIPINIVDETSVIKTKVCSDFLKKLSETKDINTSIENLEDGEIKNSIISLINKLEFNEVNDVAIEFIKYELKKIKIKSKKLSSAIECINIDEVYNDEYTYYILSFSDKLPLKYKDEDFYKDEELKNLKVLTSSEKNKNNINDFMYIYTNFKNIISTFSRKNTFVSYNISNLVEDFSIQIIDINEINYSYSDDYNKLRYAKKLDEFIKFGQKSEELEIFNSNYDIKYMKYNNKFKGIDKKNIQKPVTLSYSSLKTYNDCAFKYYIEKILKITDNESTLAIKIGVLYHYVLSKIYEDNFDFNEVYDKELENMEVTNKEKFFLELLKEDLKFIVEFLQEFNDHTELKENECEKKILIKDIIENELNFKGIIDNIKYNKEKKLAIVIDYKTGGVKPSLDNITDGFNLQLPSYVYLLNDSMPEYNVIGMYLDKILENESIDETEKMTREKLKFVGYSTSNIENLTALDSSYAESRYIKSLRISNDGFYKSAKIMDEKNIQTIKEIAKDKVKEIGLKIINAEFEIEPKEIPKVAEKCMYCKYNDICYTTNDDVIKIEKRKIEDII